MLTHWMQLAQHYANYRVPMEYVPLMGCLDGFMVGVIVGALIWKRPR